MCFKLAVCKPFPFLLGVEDGSESEKETVPGLERPAGVSLSLENKDGAFNCCGTAKEWFSDAGADIVDW